VANDRVEGTHATRLSRKLGPDLHPVTILAINTLTTNLHLHLLDEAVTNVVNPSEGISRSSGAYLREHNLNIRLVHEIGVTVNDGRHTLVEIRLAVERHLNGLHGEVGVALV